MEGNNGLWRFNNSLTTDSDFQAQIKIHSKGHKSINGDQSRWECLKYEIRNISTQYPKELPKIKNKIKSQTSENKLKIKKSTKTITASKDVSQE